MHENYPHYIHYKYNTNNCNVVRFKIIIIIKLLKINIRITNIIRIITVTLLISFTIELL